MSSVTLELEQTLHQLDPQSATLLERLVRDALELVHKTNGPAGAMKSKEYPAGYFERTAGSFHGEQLDFPDDQPPTPNPDW